jgi:hypothetical protein
MLSFILVVLLDLSGLATAAPRPPLFFEANQGQTDPQVRFLARSGDYTLHLTPTEAVLALQGPAAIRMKLAGDANAAPEVAGEDPLAGKVNYLRGSDPGRWRKDVPTYGRVRYRAVYRGIDLVFYGKDRGLEYDFVVAPGADPGAIRLAFEGAESVELDGGDLVLGTPVGRLRMPRPVLYQEAGGARREVSGGYRLEGRHVGFAVGPYDPKRPLVIDPTLVYSTYLGGSSFDSAGRIAVDAAGSVYVVGTATSADFPTTPGTVQPARNGGQFDAFIAKLSPDGSTLVYATYLGGSSADLGRGIAVDAAGNAHVTGTTHSTDFPTVNAMQPTISSFSCRETCPDGFVAKLNPSGSALVYSTYFGGSFSDEGFAIALDTTGHAYVTGTLTSDAAFLTTHLQPGDPGGTVVLKLAPDGSLVWATDFGRGPGAVDIAVDGSGATYVTGQAGPGIVMTPGAFQIAHGGGLFDAFVAKLNPAGTALVYATYLGGSGDDWGQAIAVDGAGNAYVTGATGSTNFPIMNPFQPASGGDMDAFVAKLDPTGSALVYATYLGGGSADEGFGIAVDGGGRAYVTGRTRSADFPTVHPVQATLGGGFDALVVKLAASGSALVYSTYLGGTRNDSGGGAVDGAGNVYLAGRTESLDFPTASAMQPTLTGGHPDFVAGSNAFVAKLSDAGPGGSGFTVGPTTATPDPVGPGGAETIQARVTSGSAASDVLVDVGIYDSGDRRIEQRVFSGQSFAAGEGRTYTWPYSVPATLAAGEYTVKVGVFSAHWATLHIWEDHAAGFTVQAGSPPPPPPGGCTGGITIGPTTATPSPVTRGATEAIQAGVCSGAAMSNLLIDLEVYSPGGAKVAQQVVGGQSFAAGEAKDYRWDLVVPASFADGNYTVKIGVFSGDWSTLHQWHNQAATFQVGGGGTPPPAGCTGAFTVGPTTASPSPVARGAVEAIQTRVCSGTAASNILVDLEIYNAGGQKIAQGIFANQSFAAGEALSYTWSYVVEGTLPSGTYTVKIGVFSGDWSVLHKWENQAATFVVQ